MGIYDRDYYREGSSFLGSFVERGLMCKWLIGINVVAFVLQMLTWPSPHDMRLLGPFTDALDLNTRSVLDGQVWRLLSYAFLHDVSSVWHILINMLFLWWFGSDVEDLYGPREFLAFYLMAGLMGGVAFTLTHLGGGFCVGASAAVNGVLVLCALHYPTRIILLFFILPVPIWLFVIFMVAKDAFNFLGGSGGNVAVEGHLAGAAFGLLYFKFQWRLTNLWPQFKSWKRARSRPRLRVYREEEPVATPAPAPRAPASVGSGREEEEQLVAQMDAVLEKLQRVGKDGLTESENQVLERASELLRRRRK